MSDNKSPTIKKSPSVIKEVVKPEVAQQAPKASVDSEPFKGSERIPSSWTIKPEGEGIRAFNNDTRRVFVGSVKEFNVLMRG